MKSIKRNLFYVVLITGFAVCILLTANTNQNNEIRNITPNTSINGFPYEIGKSNTFKNLQVFFITLDSGIINKEYLTLSEAMDKKLVTVIETEQVNQLAIENKSNHFIFISSGEIVKGGKQDRTIGKDIILPPKSGKVPLASFCVESGRWQQREGEILEEFSSSNYSLSSRDLKIATKKSKSQAEVWENVSRQQEKVNKNMVDYYEYADSFDVKDDKSETSLQLTLENKELQKVKKEYEAFFKDLNYDKSRTVGFAYAINGELYGVDIYHNYELFKDLWTKLLDAVLVEAISEINKKELKPITKADIQTLINGFLMSKAEIEKEEINSETTYIITSAKNIIRFETFDKREDNTLLHLNYITVDSNYSSSKNENRILRENNIQIQNRE